VMRVPSIVRPLPQSSSPGGSLSPPSVLTHDG
jgi:hypothetical protein